MRVQVRPSWPFRLPRRSGMDGCLRARRGAVARLLLVDDEPVIVTVRQPARDRVVFTARATRERTHADERAAAAYAIERMRFALGVDDDLRDFYDRFSWHPLLGRALRRHPELRVERRPEPFEALAWAICEQLIEFTRAAGIERQLVRRLGERDPVTGLRTPPTAARLAAQAPALLESLDLSHSRALALVRAAREVAAGRVDLHSASPEIGWRRLRTIPGIGPWTVEMLALYGQGRFDQVPAGDVGYLKLVGRLSTGNPRVRADEDAVRRFFAPFAPWGGLAAEHLRATVAPLVRFSAPHGARW